MAPKENEQTAVTLEILSLQITVHIPKLTHPVADWLLKTPEKPDSPIHSPSAFTPFNISWCQALAKDSSSTQQWLLDIKQDTAMEEETDFELVPERDRQVSGE